MFAIPTAVVSVNITSCYYSNNLRLKKPDGSETLLVQYSDLYGDPENWKCVNVMHRFMHFE